jgi:hypothetical protein
LIERKDAKTRRRRAEETKRMGKEDGGKNIREGD